MTTMTIANRLSWDLTPDNMARYGLDPIIPGEFTQLRHQALGIDGAALSLAGATLVMTVRRRDLSTAAADLVLLRRSLDDVGGSWSPTTMQLAADADQAAEDVDAGTGKGWYAITFAPTEQDTLLAAVGSWFYDVRAQFVDLKVLTLLRGRISIPSPRTLAAAFT